MNPGEAITRADAQINRLLSSEDIANVRLGLQLAGNVSIVIADFSVLVGLALLHPSRDINRSAEEVLQQRIGETYTNAIHSHWQETYVNGEAKHFFRALEKLERAFGTPKGRLQQIAVRLTGIFPDHVAHRFPLAFKEWCLASLEANGNLDFIGLQIPQLPPILLEVPGIKYLKLGRSKLEAIPDFIEGLHELTGIDCAGLRLQTLPAALAKLPLLESLAIHGGRFPKLPDVLPQISSLRTLRIGNGRPRLLSNLAQISQLRNLEISGNNLMPLPDDIHKLHQLTDLRIQGAVLRELPPSVADLHNLELLVVESSRLRSLPSSFAALKSLLELQLGYLQKRCNLPDLRGLESLDSLNVYFEDRPPFQYPLNWCSLPECRQLLVSGPVSSLPDEFRSLQNLRSLCFRKSAFNEFPAIIRELTNLSYLEIRDANFESEEFELDALTQLREVNFSNCGLRAVPTALYKMNWLDTINLSNNHIPISQVRMLHDYLPLVEIVTH